jgi:hypothetical protein
MVLRTVNENIVSADATAGDDSIDSADATSSDSSKATTAATTAAEPTLTNGTPPHSTTATSVTATGVAAVAASAAPVPITRLASAADTNRSSSSCGSHAVGVKSLMSSTSRWPGAGLNSRRHTLPRAATAATRTAAASATAARTTSITTAQSNLHTASNTGCSDSSADSSSSGSADPIVVYISHRWLEPEFSDCDDEHRSKYFQVLGAVAQLAQRMQQPLNRFHLWIDYSCADQVSLSYFHCTVLHLCACCHIS